MMKMCCIYTVEYWSAVKKSKIMKSAAKWLELEKVILGEVTQTQKDICHVFSLI